jgi:DNA-binding response OmpR family regulator
MSSILIIDDEKSIRKTLSEILSYEGYKIDGAGDGEEGLKRFRKKPMKLCCVILKCQNWTVLSSWKGQKNRIPMYPNHDLRSR